MSMKCFASLFAAVLISVSAYGQTAPVAKTAVTSAESPEIAEFQKVENNWTNALNQRDQYGLELVLSPLYVGVSATGDVSTRNQTVVALINQADKTETTETRVVTVRMLGDVAVASGTYVFTHKVGGGPVEEKGIFTHVFQKLHGNWVCLNAQRTPVRAAAPGVAKAKAKSESKSELPFHIPLFSKGDKSDKTGPSDQSKPQ
jgi:hypothetical protein